MSFPALKPLHSEESLVPDKLKLFDAWSTEALLSSLLPGNKDCLKARPDGTILDGHHRICVLRKRGIDVDSLLREVVTKEEF